jgi:hypothetical protein
LFANALRFRRRELPISETGFERRDLPLAALSLQSGETFPAQLRSELGTWLGKDAAQAGSLGSGSHRQKSIEARW